MSTLPAFPGAPRIGKYSFLNPCLLLRQAGKGGMGIVYEAFDVLRDQRVALKTCTNPDYSRRFYDEAIIGVGDFGKNVVQVFDIRSYQNTDYILMEWVEGTDLSRFTRDRILNDGELIGVALQLCQGLRRIHDRDIIHRDIKPANLMLTTEGIVKLADFGIAQAEEALHMPTACPVGTQLFMSPEQRNGKPADQRSDLYSAGVTLYVMATGMLSRERSSRVQESLAKGLEPIAVAANTMSPELAHIIDRCIQTDPNERFASIEDLEQSLQAIGHLAVPIIPTALGTSTELPPRDIVHRARTRMMQQNREDQVLPDGEPTIVKAAAALLPERDDQEARNPSPAAPLEQSRKALMITTLAVMLVTLVGAYAMTSELPKPADTDSSEGSPSVMASFEPTLNQSPRNQAPSTVPYKQQESLTPGSSNPKRPQEPVELEFRKVIHKDQNSAPALDQDEAPKEEQPTAPKELLVAAPDRKLNEIHKQPTVPNPEPKVADKQEPESGLALEVTEPALEVIEELELLPSLPGFEVHIDRNGRPAYVPQLDQALGSPRKLRFVALETPALARYLVQEVEVSLEVVSALGLVELGTRQKCLPWDQFDKAQAENFVAALNSHVPEGASYKFLIPTTELRQGLELAAGDCQIEHSAENGPYDQTKDGDAPSTQASVDGKIEKVDDSRLWIPFDEIGVYGLVGNVAELCIDPNSRHVSYRGGSAQDLVAPGSSISSDQSLLAIHSLKRAGLGLRLFIQL